MCILDFSTGIEHHRKIKFDCSIRYSVEGRKLVVRNYYTGEKLQAFNVSNYGSIRYWVED